MQDPELIDRLLARGAQARVKVQREFGTLSPEQLTWKPGPDRWSIAECLEHLRVTKGCYFPVLEQITTGTYRMSTFQRFSPFTRLFGRWMKDQLTEEVKKPMRTVKAFTPAVSAGGPETRQQYLDDLDVFLAYLGKCRIVDLDGTVIASPATDMITYNLRNCFQFLLEHEHRHIGQGMRVMGMNGFPK